MKFVGVTSCPTGIAHTYMAAEALEQAAKDAGHEMVVETQGSGGAEPLAQSVIDEADGVIFAADLDVVGRERFAGKPTVVAGVKDGVNRSSELIKQAEEAVKAGPKAAPVTTAPSSGAGQQVEESWPTKFRQWLMTGVSYLIPFVAAGGLLIAVGFLLNTIALGDEGYNVAGLPEGGWADFLHAFSISSLENWATLANQFGGLLFGFMVPVLAGFIAFGMADRPGIAPGFLGGAVANAIGAGFLGGIAGGLLAGAIVILMKKTKLPFALAGVWTVVAIPLFGSIVTGLVMFLVLGKPIVAVMDGLTSWLEGLSGGGNAILLGVILGSMMAIDMGGPFNKVAYFFAVASLTTSLADGTEVGLQIMAAVMAAGMVPPLALALATVLRKKLFTPAEVQQGKANWLMGASFITEGAIPFAAADPLRVIPTMMLGSGVAGGLSMAFGSASQAPHGGIFVVPLISNPLLYLVAIAAGSVVAAIAVIAAKSTSKAEHQLHDAEEAAGIEAVA